MARGKPPKQCGVEGCTNRNNARGMCRTHYGQWLRANDGVASEAATRSYQAIDTEKFWEFVKKELKLG